MQLVILRSARISLLFALLCLAACATNELALAPERPDQPWPIPAAEAESPHPAATETKGAIEPGRKYDLPALIDLAERNNPETREAWEKARQAALGVGLTEATYLPQVTAEVIGGFQRTPLPIPTNVVARGYFTANSYEALPTLTAKWLLFDFGRREGLEETVRANSFVANVDFTAAHQKIIFAVSREYFALGAARGRLHVAEESLKTASFVQDASEGKQKHGLATSVELAQARRSSAQARFNLEKAKGAAHSACTALVASMGLAPGTRIEVADSSEQRLPSAPAGDVDRFIHDALASRPDMIAAMGKIRAAEGSLKEARSSYYPTLGMEVQGYQNMGAISTDGSRYYSVNEPGVSALFRLSLPLFDGGAREARVGIARSEIEAAQASLDHTRDAAAQQVSDAYDALNTSFAEYQAALPLNEAAQTAYDASLDSYRNGIGTYTDLVNAQNALNEAQFEKVDAHANALTASAALAFASGTILNKDTDRYR